MGSKRNREVRKSVMLPPNRGLTVLYAGGVRELSSDEVNARSVGQKALGLLTLPAAWTPPFFVVARECLAAEQPITELQALLDEAANRSGLIPGRVMVRSNGIEEGLTQRGALDSVASNWADVAQTLQSLRREIPSEVELSTNWIVQSEMAAVAKGHLSNERRVRYEKRDWAIETEATDVRPTAQTGIGIRRWREGHSVVSDRLSCDSELKISLTLRRVAMWAYQDSRRFLIEWLWDGSTVHIVQLDTAITSTGENPHCLLPKHVAELAVDQLQDFRAAGPEYKAKLRKLRNASMYESLGYEMPPFYVLDSEEVRQIVKTGQISESLATDLSVLTRRPLVLRTDGTDLPLARTEMLPRSEELRSPEAAADWLRNSFAPTIQKLGLGEHNLSLIGHHFIPSVASAWAGAEPGKRWVRIEALWGIPESLYWHSHDTYEVDTEKVDLNRGFSPIFEYPIRVRARYKGTFIAPNDDGHWVHHETAPPWDWLATISSDEWVREIAHTTRRICERVGKPVQVMWFVENHPDATRHHVLPWYHGSSETVDAPVKAPRKKIKSSQERYVRDGTDWDALQRDLRKGIRIERIIVEPSDPELVRSQAFAEELGTLAKEHGIVVVLAGGILAHAYHALRRAGASVECVDLFGATEERAEFNKIVRDKVPAQIMERGEYFDIVQLRGDALVLALRRKLVEEAFEALDANSGADLIGELADVEEVVRAIRTAIQVSPEQMEEERKHKLERRGGFDQGYMLLRTASPYSISRQPPKDEFLSLPSESNTKVIFDPEALPHKSVYKRPDHRSLSDTTEELLVVETEINRLGKLDEHINFELPPDLDGRQYVSFIELSRTGGELRAAVRLQSRKTLSDVDKQTSFNFDD